jgi:glycosyltransferase involved in cell wall biosynthesis
VHVAALPAFANAEANRYNSLLYGEMQRLGVTVDEWRPTPRAQKRVDVVHVHWPESPLNKPRPVRAAGRGIELLAALALARQRGARVVWTAHNVSSHWRRYPRAERLFWRMFDRLVDGWIALSPTTVEAVVAAHPRLASVPHEVIPHGHYRDAYPDVSRTDARAALNVSADARVVGFVGRVKPYKGVAELMQRFRDVADVDGVLLVAGRCDDDDLARTLQRLAASDDRVRLHLTALSDRELSTWVRACDVLVLPYVDVLNSGSALLALSLGVPVLAPDRGAIADLAANVPAWVTTYDGDLTAAALAAASAAAPAGTPDLSRYEWAPIAAATAAFYRRLTGAVPTSSG